MNKVFLIGRAAKEPEIKDFSSGRLARLTIATNDSFSRDKTYFFNCTCFDKRVDYVANYIHKGDLLTVEGRLTKRKITTRDGNNAEITDIVIDNINKLASSSKITTEPMASVEQNIKSNIQTNQQAFQTQKYESSSNANTAKVTFDDDKNETDSELDFLPQNENKE